MTTSPRGTARDLPGVALAPGTPTGSLPTDEAFRHVPFMGVIRVNVEAMKSGYRMGDPSWSNLGQGQPEVGAIPGAPPRLDRIDVGADDHAYGPVEGIDELREAVAAHYNRLYRQGKPSQYTADNVAISAGGRLGLSRCGAVLSQRRLGYFTPDYTAYEDLLTTFCRHEPLGIELDPARGFRIDPEELEARVQRDGLGMVLISNPCNPTGVLIDGELGAWLDLARRRGCVLLLDEFYSHYVFRGGTPGAGPVSGAAHVEDVDRDPVIIFDGLTKCFRYPGWRVGWVVAPRTVIRNFTAAGSFLDGGPSRPIQRAAIDILEPDRADQETDAVRREFAAKQHLTVSRLEALGVEFPARPDGTFYAWGCVRNLAPPLADGEGFMRAAFGHRVLTVPGAYFDVNPWRKRTGPSPWSSYVRFSFGPPRDNVEAGLDRLAEMVRTM